jgi:hypothetical protein
MFLGLPDPDPLVRDRRIRILLLSRKKVRKTSMLTVFWLLYDFLSLKNDVNAPSKSNEQKNLKKK